MHRLAQGAYLAAAFAIGYVVSLCIERKRRRRQSVCAAIEDMIGNTPMVELQSLSRLTGRRILAKLEYANPCGSGKDRVAYRIISQALRERPSRRDIAEGTTGSTGLSLALLSNRFGLTCSVFMPDDVSEEKISLLRLFGAKVTLVPPYSIVDERMYINAAARYAQDVGGVFCNQFESEENIKVHYETTGPEIWEQCCGRVQALVLGAGTAGSIVGIARYLKERDNQIRVILADPPGSGLFNKVKYSVMYSGTEAEGTRRRAQTDSIIEGVGLNRNTGLMAQASIDDAERVSDQEAVTMARYLVRHEGLFVGSSSAMNCAAVLKVARKFPEGSVIVTVFSDQGYRHLSKFWCDEYLSKCGIATNLPIETLFQ